MQFDIEYLAKTQQNLQCARMHYVKCSGLNSARVHLESVISLHDSEDHKIQDIWAKNLHICIISYS